MSKANLTINEIFGIPSVDGHQRIFYNDSTVSSGELDSGACYKVVSNNDCHFAVCEQGAAEIGVTQGHYLASGQQDFLATDNSHRTIQVQRATTGGTLYLTKLKARGA